jgi:hypothetical protein
MKSEDYARQTCKCDHGAILISSTGRTRPSHYVQVYVGYEQQFSTLHIEGCCACPKHTVWVRLGAIIPAFTRRYRTRLNLPTVDEFALRRFVLPSQRSLSSESKVRLYSGHKLGFHPDMCSYILAAVARLMHGLHWYLLEVFVLIWRRLRHQHHKTSVSATIQ